MLAEARRRCADLPSARIFQTDGVSVRAELTPEQADLAERADYMGYAFGYAELKSFLKELTGGEATLIRVDAVHIYGWIQRP